tara:strand:+ start:70258 stop:71553 length:1296 start_codon:yes stop_codon:yes gene_type:complete
MLWTRSFPTTKPQALEALNSLQLQYPVDIFLSQNPQDKKTHTLAGVLPKQELHITQHTPRTDIADFAFCDPLPTLGFLSYNYGLHLHDIKPAKPSSFPLGHLKKYTLYIRYNELLNRLEIFSLTPQEILSQEIQKILASPSTPKPKISPLKTKGPLTSSLNKDHYIGAVKKVLDAIRCGNTYQLNLSLHLKTALEEFNSYTFFRGLFEEYPASYYAHFNTHTYSILSTSPEQFLKVHQGKVLSEPIKGTLSLGPCDIPEECAAHLRGDEKEEAELSMIVDLIRNDISKHCAYGSVFVQNHKQVFQVDQLLQMYSTISGTLKPESTSLDLLLDSFPGGSITGFPKKRSMEIIEVLEPHSRDIYCGSFFALYNERNLDSSIAIRTGYWDKTNQTLNLYAGSGITLKSKPEAEYHETMAKLTKFTQLIKEPSHT